jgi:hypothetical protein
LINFWIIRTAIDLPFSNNMRMRGC